MQRQPNFGAIPEIPVREAQERLDHPTAAPAFIDVREPDEFAEGHAAGTVNIPLSQLQQRVAEVPRDREVLLICHLGGRSMQAAKWLRTQGVEQVVNIDGGTDAWQRAGLPMAK